MTPAPGAISSPVGTLPPAAEYCDEKTNCPSEAMIEPIILGCFLLLLIFSKQIGACISKCAVMVRGGGKEVH